ncbi:MAG: hypothetical protein VW338_13705 [Rhodospirillaceae bacterium]|jgi:hypothetical protein
MTIDPANNALVVGVFAATYVGMALGRVPGLRIDRSGIALFAVAVLWLVAGGWMPLSP